MINFLLLSEIKSNVDTSDRGDCGIQLSAVFITPAAVAEFLYVHKPVVAVLNLLSACCVLECLKWCCLELLPVHRHVSELGGLLSYLC